MGRSDTGKPNRTRTPINSKEWSRTEVSGKSYLSNFLIFVKVIDYDQKSHFRFSSYFACETF